MPLTEKYSRLIAVQDQVEALIKECSAISEVMIFGSLVEDFIFNTADFNFLIISHVKACKEFNLNHFAKRLRLIIGRQFTVDVDTPTSLPERFADSNIFRRNQHESLVSIRKIAVRLSDVYIQANRYLQTCQQFDDLISRNDLLRTIETIEGNIVLDLFTEGQKRALLELSHLYHRFKLFDLRSIYRVNYYEEISLSKQKLLHFCKDINPFVAATNNEHVLMRKLLDIDRDYVINYRDPIYNNMPLHCAIFGRHIETAHLLLDAGADPFKIVNGKTVFDIAMISLVGNLHDLKCRDLGLRLTKFDNVPQSYLQHFPGYEHLIFEAKKKPIQRNGIFGERDKRAAVTDTQIEKALEDIAKRIRDANVSDRERFVEIFRRELNGVLSPNPHFTTARVCKPLQWRPTEQTSHSFPIRIASITASILTKFLGRSNSYFPSKFTCCQATGDS